MRPHPETPGPRRVRARGSRPVLLTRPTRMLPFTTTDPAPSPGLDIEAPECH